MFDWYCRFNLFQFTAFSSSSQYLLLSLKSPSIRQNFLSFNLQLWPIRRPVWKPHFQLGSINKLIKMLALLNYHKKVGVPGVTFSHIDFCFLMRVTEQFYILKWELPVLFYKIFRGKFKLCETDSLISGSHWPLFLPRSVNLIRLFIISLMTNAFEETFVQNWSLGCRLMYSVYQVLP